MANWYIDGYTFNLSNEDANMHLEVDEQSRLLEIVVNDNNGNKNTMYINGDGAFALAMWLKDRVS